MISGTRFAHVNLIAKDWRTLARFYQAVFSCVRVGPERDIAGELPEAGTGVQGARIRGVHLRLPGHEEDSLTLEVFEYQSLKGRSATAVSRPGFAHIAFQVDDVASARDEVLAAGGGTVGELASFEIPGAGKITWIYVTDPEGNVIELQSWSE